MSGADAPTSRRPRLGAWMRLALVGGALLLGSGCSLVSQLASGMDHQVVRNPSSAQAVPFDRAIMARTFQPSDVGGVEMVVANDPANPSQVGQVRSYLQEEAVQFQQGQYEDLAKAHGMDMPGSRELEAGYSRVRVSYSDIPNGGQVTYIASDPALIQALHSWFDRRQMGG